MFFDGVFLEFQFPFCAVYRFAAALINQPLWVMNVVPVHEQDTLSVIFDRGLIGVYHDWCESFNTYPRTYDLLHSSFLLGNLTKRYLTTLAALFSIRGFTVWYNHNIFWKLHIKDECRVKLDLIKLYNVVVSNLIKATKRVPNEYLVVRLFMAAVI